MLQIHLEDVLKTYGRRLAKTFLGRLEDVFRRGLANTSWRRFGRWKNVTLKTSWKTRYIWKYHYGEYNLHKNKNNQKPYMISKNQRCTNIYVLIFQIHIPESIFKSNKNIYKIRWLNLILWICLLLLKMDSGMWIRNIST